MAAVQNRGWRPRSPRPSKKLRRTQLLTVIVMHKIWPKIWNAKFAVLCCRSAEPRFLYLAFLLLLVSHFVFCFFFFAMPCPLCAWLFPFPIAIATAATAAVFIIMIIRQSLQRVGICGPTQQHAQEYIYPLSTLTKQSHKNSLLCEQNKFILFCCCLLPLWQSLSGQASADEASKP